MFKQEIKGKIWYRVGDSNCTRCELAQNRKERPVVPNLLNPESELAVLGLAPGGDEGKPENMIPFVGAAGKKLRDALTKANVNPLDISYINAALCWPPNNKLNKKITDACSIYLEESLSLLPNLKAVLLLGGEACKAISGANKTVMKDLYLRPFKVDKYGDILFIPNYHPASILYNPAPAQVALFYDGIKQSIEIYKALKEIKKPVTSVIVKDEATLFKCLDFLATRPFIAYDSEFTSLQFPISDLLTLHFSSEENTAIGFPYKWWDGSSLVHYWSNEVNEQIAQRLKYIFTSPSISTCGQNIKIDSIMLRKEFGFRIENIVFDTMGASFLLDSNVGTGLEDIIAREIPEKAGRKSKFWGDDFNKDWYKYIPLDEILKYGNDDAMDTFKIANIFAARL